MEKIFYKRVWELLTQKFSTRCPYRKGMFVGSHGCFFCKFCEGRTEEAVGCSFKDFYRPQQPKEYASLDVMVKGEFRRTIRVKRTYLEGVLQERVSKSDIEKVVAEKCPLTFKYEKWEVEYND